MTITSGRAIQRMQDSCAAGNHGRQKNTGPEDNLVDAHGKPAGAAVTTDPGIVCHCQEVKERRWSLATPFSEFRQ
ncbi:hypothetical protein IU459_24775 [Nocardia amamiensis]|uniref:DUF6879 domain-containing protein n=1 Tax=Nocardia amamiensis TaxID=404578 RepID=A0ABS0D0T9_9NOCA|nr:DUF6879 family protein [Nocardia amamiensis]MBF6300734.1 hypothetical protein [Nocardia amamiensis]